MFEIVRKVEYSNLLDNELANWLDDQFAAVLADHHLNEEQSLNRMLDLQK